MGLGGAEAALVRAFTLNPHLAEAHRHFGWYQFLIGRQTDALAALTRAKQMEPLAPLYTAELAWLQLVLGQFEEATAGAIESLHLNAEFPIGLYVLGCVALEQGRYDEALSAHRHAVAVSPGWKWALGYTCARAGLSREAHQIILECGDESPRDAWEAWTVAYVALGLDDKNRVLDALEIAYQYRHSWMPWIGVIPMFDALHAEPRFADLLRRLQSPDAAKPNARSG